VKRDGIDDASGYWFAGLTDGEGCFTLNEDGGDPQSSRVFRQDDAPVLGCIRTPLGLGRSYRKTAAKAAARGPSRAGESFSCQ
jgi:hypothetical protein